jgi:hypothetical protein
VKLEYMLYHIVLYEKEIEILLNSLYSSSTEKDIVELLSDYFISEMKKQ